MFRASSSSWTEGESENRTDFGDAAAGLSARRDFLRNEEEDVTRGLSDARAKSFSSDGLLGWEMVEEVVSVR